MIHELKECYLLTHINDLPDIINSNNDAIKSEFGNIYDSTLNIITKSIYAPTGIAKSYFGDFDELQAEYITVSNPSSFKATITSTVIECIGDDISTHNDLQGRWSTVDASNTYGANADLMHDASAIAYLGSDGTISSLYRKIKSIEDGSISKFFDPSTQTTATALQLSETIDWKNSLFTSTVLITDDHGITGTYKIVCSSTSAPTYTLTVNSVLNSILGTSGQVPDIPDSEVDDLYPMACNIYNGQN